MILEVFPEEAHMSLQRINHEEVLGRMEGLVVLPDHAFLRPADGERHLNAPVIALARIKAKAQDRASHSWTVGHPSQAEFLL